MTARLRDGHGSDARGAMTVAKTGLCGLQCAVLPIPAEMQDLVAATASGCRPEEHYVLDCDAVLTPALAERWRAVAGRVPDLARAYREVRHDDVEGFDALGAFWCCGCARHVAEIVEARPVGQAAARVEHGLLELLAEAASVLGR